VGPWSPAHAVPFPDFSVPESGRGLASAIIPVPVLRLNEVLINCYLLFCSCVAGPFDRTILDMGIFLRI
jgi:hypothetical protein